MSDTEQIPDIIKVIRMYRSERELTFQEARDTAVREFRKRGWDVPESIAKVRVS